MVSEEERPVVGGGGGEWKQTRGGPAALLACNVLLVLFLESMFQLSGQREGKCWRVVREIWEVEIFFILSYILEDSDTSEMRFCSRGFEIC